MKRVKFDFTFYKDMLGFGFALSKGESVKAENGVFSLDRKTLSLAIIILFWQFDITIYGRKVKDKK